MKPLGSLRLVSNDRSRADMPRHRARPSLALCRRGGMLALALAIALPAPMALLPAPMAFAQGQELAPIKVDLPPQPNFNVNNAPETYPTGELSVYGLRKKMNQFLDKDVQVKAYLTEIYECPAEQRKCNDELAAKNKKTKAKEAKQAKAPGKKGAPPPPAADPKAAAMAGGCRPCDQAHFFMSDTPGGKKERALLIADYPVKDWNTGKPKPLVAKIGEQYVITGMFAINSMTGFAASDGLIIHKKFQDSSGKVIAEGNAVLPPDAQDIKLEGKPAEKVGAARIDAAKGGGK
jgi:hypothetical protein